MNLRKKLEGILKIFLLHPLISGSGIVLIGSFLANIFNYIFNLSMLRLLSVEQYGLLTALSSLIVLFGIFNVAFSNLFAKFAATYYGRHDKNGLYHLTNSGTKTILFCSVVLFVFQLAFIKPIASFIHIDQTILLILIFLSIFLSMFASLPYGLLQGQMKFILLSGINIAQPFLKVILGIALVVLGYSLLGAVSAVVLATLIPVIFGFWYIYSQNVSASNVSTFDNKAFLKEILYSGYTFFFSAIGLTFLLNTDVIIVRHFLHETVAGQYAALSLMGKAIFYLTSPIGMVFFPLIAYKKERKERLFGTVFLAMGVVALVSAAISVVYFLFPGLVLAVFAPAPEYRVLSVYLGLFSLYIFFFSLFSLLNSFFLSIGKTVVIYFTLLAAILQVILLALFHENLYQVIYVLITVSCLLFFSFMLYYLKYGKD